MVLLLLLLFEDLWRERWWMVKEVARRDLLRPLVLLLPFSGFGSMGLVGGVQVVEGDESLDADLNDGSRAFVSKRSMKRWGFGIGF